MERKKLHGVGFTRVQKNLQKKIIFIGFILWKDVKGMMMQGEIIHRISLLNKAKLTLQSMWNIFWKYLSLNFIKMFQVQLHFLQSLSYIQNILLLLHCNPWDAVFGLSYKEVELCLGMWKCGVAYSSVRKIVVHLWQVHLGVVTLWRTTLQTPS